MRRRLGRSRALQEAGRYSEGRDYMFLFLSLEAKFLGYAPLAAEAGHALATQ